MKLRSLFLVAMLSCNKDVTDDGLKNVTAKKIQWEWQVDSININQSIGGVKQQESYPGDVAEYVDFRPDGNMYTYFQGNRDTSRYTVESDTELIIDGDAALIQQLTDNKFILYTRDDAGSIGFVEVTYHLRR